MQNLVENYLEAAEGAGSVLAHARLLIKLTHLYEEIAPTHLGQASSVANYKSGIIIIHAVSGAVAAKLRQMAPRLADDFSKRGLSVTRFRSKCKPVKLKANQGLPRKNRLACEPVTSSRALPARCLRRHCARHSKPCSHAPLNRNDGNALKNHQRKNQ